MYEKELSRGFISQMLRNPIYAQADLELYEFFKGQGAVVVNEAADFAGTNGCYLYQGRDVQERKNKDLKNQILVLAPSEGIVPADTWLAGKVKCGHCGRALKSIGNRAGTQYRRCTKRVDNMSCEGCGTLRTAEFEQFVYEAMVHKLSEFQTLTAKAETVNPKLTALNVELAQVEDEIEKLLNTLTGASAVLMSYANGKIEELDDRRQVADIILSQVHATADRVSFEWKIGFLTPSALFNGVFTIIKRCYILGLPQIIFRDYLTIPLSKSQAP